MIHTKPFVPDEILIHHEFFADEKKFQVTLRRNALGPFVRIKETYKKRHNIVIFPASGLADIAKIMEDFIKHI